MAVLALAGCQRPSESQRAPRPQAIRTVAVRTGGIQERVDYLGTVHPQRSVQVLAQVPGTLMELPLEEGAQVKKGQVLARIAAPENTARVLRTRAERERARAERDHACERYATDVELGQRGDLARAQVDVGKKGCAAARAAFSAANAAFRETSALTARSLERAPFDGVVLDWIADPGQTVTPGRPLLRLGSPELELRVAVSERDALRGVKAGTVALLRIGDVEVRAKVSHLAPQATGPARSRDAHILLEGPEAEVLVPGMSVGVSFVLSESPDAVAVPRRALRTREGKTSVYVVTGDRLSEQEVSVGPEQDGWVAIEPALPKDTLVAVGDLATLDPKRPVYAVTEVTQ